MKQPSANHALACVIPFVIYLLGSAWLSKLPTNWYWLGYALTAGSSLAAFVWLVDPDFRRQLLRVHRRVWPGILVGIVGIALWIVLSHGHLEAKLANYLPSFLQPSERVGFNPWEQLDGQLGIAAFITVRVLGIAIVVPLVEELFWRGFLLRWLIDADWQKVPVGTFTWPSCLGVTALFTLAHPEWLAAAVYCLLINALLYWKKDLWQCVVAHAVSNLLLAIYVLQSDNWWLW